MTTAALAQEGNANKIEPYDVTPQTRTIYGSDDSWTASSRDKQGYSAVGKLYITFPNGSVQQGTGFIYGDAAMGTAAHFLYDGRYGGKAKSIRIVLPSRTITVSGSALKYPAEFAAGATSTDPGNPLYDYGVIKLPAGTGSSSRFGLYANGADVGPLFLSSGYRAGQTSARVTSEIINKVSTRELYLKHDILAGQSGSPIYDQEGYVVGILNYAGSWSDTEADDHNSYNRAAKLNSTVFNFLKNNM